MWIRLPWKRQTNVFFAKMADIRGKANGLDKTFDIIILS